MDKQNNTPKKKRFDEIDKQQWIESLYKMHGVNDKFQNTIEHTLTDWVGDILYLEIDCVLYYFLSEITFAIQPFNKKDIKIQINISRSPSYQFPVCANVVESTLETLYVDIMRCWFQVIMKLYKEHLKILNNDKDS